IPKTEILITIVNESKYTLTNVTMYFNGTSINPASLNIAPFTDPSNVRFDATLHATKGMLCYQIEGTPNYLLISWKVSFFRKNEFCVYICANRSPEEQKEKNIFRQHIHKEYKKAPDEIIQTGYKDFRVSATMSSGNEGSSNNPTKEMV
ncbi:976_t:CDS:2, partial [Dentiscutata erythropus]